MMKNEIEAQQCLASLSQVTNYIFQWQEPRPKNLQKYTIEEKKDEDQNQHSPFAKRPKKQRKVIVTREVSEKYDLKKWEKRAQAINNIQFPIIHDHLEAFQQQFVLPKYKINAKQQLNERNANISEGKQSINKKIIQAIENQYIMRKLERFQKKLQSSKKNVFKQESSMRILKYIPKGPSRKKIISLGKDNNQKQIKTKVSSKSQIQKLKKQLDKNKRKFSLPNLFKFQSRYELL